MTSKIPALCKQKGITLKSFVRECLVNDVCAADTARRAFNGGVDLNMRSAAGICLMLGVSFDEAFQLNKVSRGHSPRLQVGPLPGG